MTASREAGERARAVYSSMWVDNGTHSEAEIVSNLAVALDAVATRAATVAVDAARTVNGPLYIASRSVIIAQAVSRALGAKV